MKIPTNSGSDPPSSPLIETYQNESSGYFSHPYAFDYEHSRLVQEGRGRLAADLEDVNDNEDENVKVAKGDAFRFKGICLRGIYLRVF